MPFVKMLRMPKSFPTQYTKVSALSLYQFFANILSRQTEKFWNHLDDILNVITPTKTKGSQILGATTLHTMMEQYNTLSQAWKYAANITEAT